jgi:glycosyltransferase involved in cell wall biosynthesis
MRVLVLSTLYPPAALGGYEVECSSVVERLREHHDVLVLTTDAAGAGVSVDAGAVAGAGEPAEVEVRRELALLRTDSRGALRAPLASLRAVGSARRALSWRPDFVYVWNAAAIPQACVRVLADSGCPLAFRVCEHWFSKLFVVDQFLRELLPAPSPHARRWGRAAWAGACRALNAMPMLRLEPTASMRTAVSWNSEAIRRMAPAPQFVSVVLERVEHSVPRYGDTYAGVVREPASTPEIVFVGRVTPYKGLSVAIRALALLRSVYSMPARLVVIGPEDAAHGQEMRRLAQGLGVGPAIDWRGQASPQQIAAALARAHAMIVPSVWEEPFPLVTLEGALARVPLVAADVGGIGEGVHHEEHALLFAREDAEAAAAALARTMTEHEQTKMRVARAYRRAQSFQIGPYLDAQERFVSDSHAALSEARSLRPDPPQPRSTPRA